MKRSTTGTVTRRTTELDTPIYHRNQYSSRETLFRVTVIIESLSVSDDGASEYYVEIKGRMQTAAGGDHARNKGEFTWSDSGMWASQTVAIPVEIKAYLIGRDALAGLVLIS